MASPHASLGDALPREMARVRDVNEPFQSDYLDMATAALRAMQEAGRE